MVQRRSSWSSQCVPEKTKRPEADPGLLTRHELRLFDRSEAQLWNERHSARGEQVVEAHVQMLRLVPGPIQEDDV
jgi:hypothetical protein